MADHRAEFREACDSFMVNLTASRISKSLFIQKLKEDLTYKRYLKEKAEKPSSDEEVDAETDHEEEAVDNKMVDGMDDLNAPESLEQTKTQEKLEEKESSTRPQAEDIVTSSDGPILESSVAHGPVSNCETNSDSRCSSQQSPSGDVTEEWTQEQVKNYKLKECSVKLEILTPEFVKKAQKGQIHWADYFKDPSLDAIRKRKFQPLPSEPEYVESEVSDGSSSHESNYSDFEDDLGKNKKRKTTGRRNKTEPSIRRKTICSPAYL